MLLEKPAATEHNGYPGWGLQSISHAFPVNSEIVS
jgi:hypothetical protein